MFENSWLKEFETLEDYQRYNNKMFDEGMHYKIVMTNYNTKPTKDKPLKVVYEID